MTDLSFPPRPPAPATPLSALIHHAALQALDEQRLADGRPDRIFNAKAFPSGGAGMAGRFVNDLRNAVHGVSETSQ